MGLGPHYATCIMPRPIYSNTSLISYTVLDTRQRHNRQKKKTPSLAVRRLSYNAAVFFQGKCKRYCILAYKFASYFSCYEIIAIF